MRLIDADALDEKLEELKVRYMAQGRKAVAEDYNFIQTVLLTAPTVDAVEVVHGRWIISSDGYYPYCSECKEEPKHGEMTNYCPNCGAKMDLEC